MPKFVPQFPSATPAYAPRSSQCVKRAQEGWREILDTKLLDWKKNPSQFGDEIEPPTMDALRAAVEFVESMLCDSWPLPDWVVPLGDGGLAFRWGEAGRDILNLEIDPSGNATWIRMKNSRIVSRSPAPSLS